MSNWKYINESREAEGFFATSESDGFNGLFWVIHPESRTSLKVVASDGMGWRHVSVSRVGDSRVPTWAMMCWVKELFWDDEDWAVQFHPAKSEYVNNHTGCLHLWQPTDAIMPTPESVMVGIK